MTPIKDFLESLEVRSAQLLALETELKARSQDVLKEAFTDFFKACPDIAGFGWTQYTPYFNDGDECTFRINEFTFTKNKEIVLEEVSSAYELEDEGGFSVSDYRHNADECTADENKACLAIEALANQLEDICKSVYGDHSNIIVSPTAVYISEYDHD